MKLFCKSMVLTILNCLLLVSSVSADPFPDTIVEFIPGSSAGFGQQSLPDVILGPPQGAGATAGGLDVLSLGDGGIIVLEFVDNRVINGPGPDLIVFENAFLVAGNPENVFCETAFVEVSYNGIDYFRFPNDYDPDGQPINNPTNWYGFAGVSPVLSHPDNSIDPTDPTISGGDLFDLDDVGLNEIRFVRIIDTNESENAAVDDDGDVIYDPGMPGGDSAGFDLDAMAAVYSEELFTPTPVATISPTATATSVPTPTPTQNSEFSFELVLSDRDLVEGDRFLLETKYENPNHPYDLVHQYIILDTFGVFYFYPNWTTGPAYKSITIASGVSSIRILDFIWPSVAGHAEGLILWGGLVDTDGSILGFIQQIEFEY